MASPSSHQPQPWILRDRRWTWGDRTYLMGVLNVTPDSFSDGGQFDRLEAALAQAHQLAAEGADWLDIGGESTRPQAAPVSAAAEADRVLPVIAALRRGWQDFGPLDLPISIDTTKAEVARAAIAAGADVVNDVSGGLYDPAMLPTVAELGVPVILMHLRGTPQTMQQLTDYDDYPDVVAAVAAALGDRIAAAVAAGIPTEKIAIDPGIGFAKTTEQNLELMRRLPELRSLGHPVLVGPSRKSFIGKILDRPDPQQRVWGTGAACAACVAGGADWVRVHDLAAMRDVVRVSDALWRGWRES
ncbi:MAG: dihydropteroate synthase [Oscillatoriales cyanobacterium]|nr:MAG: dihydropteroate synthase [Oscillatoriales cyanobacterium]